MYERLGFERTIELDFRQGDLEVFGFKLTIRSSRSNQVRVLS